MFKSNDNLHEFLSQISDSLMLRFLRLGKNRSLNLLKNLPCYLDYHIFQALELTVALVCNEIKMLLNVTYLLLIFHESFVHFA